MNNMSISQACRLHTVPRATVQYRLHGTILDIKKKTGPAPLPTNKGEEEILKFFKRHPELRSREAESINKARSVVTEESIRQWFGELQTFLKDNNFENVLKDSNRVINCDESGFQMCPKTGKIIAPKGFKNQSMPETWVLGISDSRWMEGDVFYEYIANDFNNWIIEQKIKKPIILFLGGHKSHMTLALSKFCDKNQIILYALPPNKTRILQPTD
ncbi:hypothetical protein ILUMI_14428, partial [Ignelater luminosus]